ncbi:31689_t:CDS:2 [Racocetra persica]|uniref:31689_t:CDS:1 n=1 Tax=Racocetra persica TaxID=160502 RepID=A0ACA9KBK5_9GLOM|nr:31689_t:CDS:2 [Racocetra persica]
MKNFESPNIYSVLAPDDTDDAQSEDTPTTSTTRPSQDDYFEEQIEEIRLKHSLGQNPLYLGSDPSIQDTNDSKHLYECQGCTLFDRCDINISRYHEKPLIPIQNKENKIKNKNSKQNFKPFENFGELLDSDLLKSYNGPSDIKNNLMPRKNNGFTYSESIRSLALFISFGHKIEYPVEEFHRFGFHPVFKSISYLKCLDIKSLRKFVLNCAINCWANAWKIAIVLLSNSNQTQHISHLIREIRGVCDRLVLDVIVIHTLLYREKEKREKWEIQKSEPSAVIYRYPDSDILQNLLNDFAQSVRVSYNDPVYFYNKDEPYYEFTNFFWIRIRIDEFYWPSTENYFQAQKFHSNFLRETIRKAWSAREAFIIARRNDCHKRHDWESEDPVKGIFKEHVMRKALFAKFRQHEKLKYKLLSTSTAPLFEHTENDKYWGDGGKFGKGKNRLGQILMEVRNQLMQEEISLLMDEYIRKNERWFITELTELNKFD